MTETTVVKATETAIVKATETAVVKATQTAVVKATQTAVVKATQTAAATDRAANQLPTTGVDSRQAIQVGLIVFLVTLLFGAGIWETRRLGR